MIVVGPGSRRTVSSTRNRHKVNISINCCHLQPQTQLHLGRQAPSVNGNTRLPSPCCQLQQTCNRTSYQLCAKNLLTVTTTCCTPSRTKTSRARLAFRLVKFRAACWLAGCTRPTCRAGFAMTPRRPQSWANIEIATDLSLLLW